MNLGTEVEHYLEWRRRTRFIRRHGGLLLADGFILAAILLLWMKAIERQRGHAPPVIDRHPPESGMSSGGRRAMLRWEASRRWRR